MFLFLNMWLSVKKKIPVHKRNIIVTNLTTDWLKGYFGHSLPFKQMGLFKYTAITVEQLKILNRIQ